MPRQAEVKSLYYITHVDNVASILQHGILSHGQIESRGIPFKPVYDAEIVSRRKGKAAPDGRSLWEYANVYFQPRNPMMYRVVHEKGHRELAVVGVVSAVLSKDRVFITDGNAANNATCFFAASEGLRVLQDNWQTLQLQYWNDRDGSKRKIMAECLVPEEIAPENIHTIYVADHKTREKVQGTIPGSRVPVVSDSDMFFQPRFSKRIGNVSLIDGDMFFSSMQTLTVSVNLQSIMGKGLASRAKYQFPDVYVVYQNACRSKRITATRPFVYKREASLDEELADLSSPISTPNAVKWFLLFATKRKWRENSRMEDVEGGLHWFREHFKLEGVQSVAMPALGCGLGGLGWVDVGPLMFRYLHGIGIDVAIYLPRERITDTQYLSEGYLLGTAT